MVGIPRIDGVPEFANAKRVDERGKRGESQETRPVDGLLISPEAKAASEAAHLLRVTEEESEVREERVAQAIEKVEKGAYKVREIVRQVAARIAGSIEIRTA